MSGESKKPRNCLGVHPKTSTEVHSFKFTLYSSSGEEGFYRIVDFRTSVDMCVDMLNELNLQRLEKEGLLLSLQKWVAAEFWLD